MHFLYGHLNMGKNNRKQYLRTKINLSIVFYMNSYNFITYFIFYGIVEKI